jgi:putative thioredoxin
MTNPRPQNAAQNAAPDRFAARAVDLAAVKQAADQREKAKEEAASGRPVPVSATVTAESFEQDLVVRSTQVPVLLQLGSSRAQGSDDMAADFARLAAEQEISGDIRWVFRLVDVDATPEIAQALGVRAVPTVLALAGGRPLTNFEGVQPEDQLRQFVAAVLQATAGKLPGLPATGGEDAPAEEDGDPRFTEAAEALEREDYTAAVAVYDRILADGPEPEVKAEAQTARATAVLLGRTSDGSGDDVDALLLAGQRKEGFDTLIGQLQAAVTEGRTDERDALRDRLLGLFALYDPADPEVIDARTRMASALF